MNIENKEQKCAQTQIKNFNVILRQLLDKIDDVVDVKQKILEQYPQSSAQFSHSKHISQNFTNTLTHIKQINLLFKNTIIQELKSMFYTLKKQNEDDVLGIARYYQKMKGCYQQEIQSLKDQIKRQYKVIALMKQQVEDLMTMLNYSSEKSQSNRLPQAQNSIKNAQNTYKLNFQNIHTGTLSVIQQQTERTVMSSERQKDNIEPNIFSEQASPNKNIEQQTGFNFINKLDCLNDAQRDANITNQEIDNRFMIQQKQFQKSGKKIIKNKHLQSIFCFNDDIIEMQEQVIRNCQNTNQSLFFQKQDQNSENKYENYMKSHLSQSQDKSQDSKISNITHKQQIQNGSGYTNNVISFLGNVLEDKNSLSESGRYFKSHSKRKSSQQDPQWQTLSERFIVGLKQVNNKNQLKKIETQQSIQCQDDKTNPKTKQFLQQFRKTFNKCLNSMHVAKKNSTKSNLRQALKGNETSKSAKTGETNNLTFGNSHSYEIQNIEKYQKVSQSSKTTKTTPKNKQNLKVLDTMIKQIQMNNKFLIGNKKIQLKYQGEKKNGIRSGNGVLYYSNGLAYEGQFKDGVRNGYGILKFNHIEIYNGDWKNDEIEGQGKIRNCAIINKKKPLNHNSCSSLLNRWISYNGDFKNSRFQGSGTLHLQGGEKFVGKFINGQANGEGIVYRKNGQIEQGIWKNNNLIKQSEK